MRIKFLVLLGTSLLLGCGCQQREPRAHMLADGPRTGYSDTLPSNGSVLFTAGVHGYKRSHMVEIPYGATVEDMAKATLPIPGNDHRRFFLGSVTAMGMPVIVEFAPAWLSAKKVPHPYSVSRDSIGRGGRKYKLSQFPELLAEERLTATPDLTVGLVLHPDVSMASLIQLLSDWQKSEMTCVPIVDVLMSPRYKTLSKRFLDELKALEAPIAKEGARGGKRGDGGDPPGSHLRH